MQIDWVSVFNISHGKLETKDHVSNQSIWDIPTVYAIRNADTTGQYIQSIKMEIMRKSKNKIVTLNITTEFLMSIKGSLIPATEEDYSIYAQLTNIAFSHGRAIFHELTKGTEFGKDYITLKPIDHFIKCVKSATFQINN